jgi:hypothetical protein
MMRDFLYLLAVQAVVILGGAAILNGGWAP